jgi:hypothetical protein
MNKCYFNAGKIFSALTVKGKLTEHNPSYLGFLEGNLYIELLQKIYLDLALYEDNTEFKINTKTSETYTINISELRKSIRHSISTKKEIECDPDNGRFITEILIGLLDILDTKKHKNIYN